MTAGAADGAGRRHFSLGAKLTVALLAVAAALSAYLILVFGPHATSTFFDRSAQLIERGTGAMRELAREEAERDREVLIDLIAHSGDARQRMLADLPLSLYRGDVERIRAAIEREDAARDERLRRSAAVLAAETERRAMQRIDAHVAMLRDEQSQMVAAFARELRASYLLLAGGVLAVLVAVLGVGLWRTVVRPVRALGQMVRAVAGGDLGVDVRIRSGDEVGDLSADFSAMVRQLAASRDEIRNKNAELQQWNARLESEVRAKTAHLEQAVRNLEAAQRQLVHAAKMASLGTLAGGVAHEFNNLVGGIRGCAAEALAGEADPDRREALEIIVRTADRAAGVTQQLLRFAKQRVGAMAQTDVSALLREALQLVEPRARRQQVAIAAAIPEGLTAYADGGALHQVLLNLLTNAVQAMPGGGALKVGARVAGGELEISVADTGVGIAPDAIDRIFDPFYTSKGDAEDPAERGSGLGLSVSHGIAEAHGGTLRASSELGRGSVFTLRIPLASAEHNDG